MECFPKYESIPIHVWKDWISPVGKLLHWGGRENYFQLCNGEHILSPQVEGK